MGLWQRLRATSVDAAPVKIFNQDLNLLHVINNLKLSHSQMQKNNPVYTLPENFTVMAPEELEVLLQQFDSEKFAVLTRLSEARSQIEALQNEEANFALDAKL